MSYWISNPLLGKFNISISSFCTDTISTNGYYSTLKKKVAWICSEQALQAAEDVERSLKEKKRLF